MSNFTAKLKIWCVRPRANGRNIIGQQLRSQHCWVLHVAFICTPWCMLLDVVACCWIAQSLKPVKLFSQQLPTFLLFRDRRSVAQQCWISLNSSSNIVGATHAHYVWITKTYGLYSSYEALQVPNLLGVVASVCTPLPTRKQQLPTMLTQQCCELLGPFPPSLRMSFCEIWHLFSPVPIRNFLYYRWLVTYLVIAKCKKECNML